jgi:tetratricopeptide (TPR) repeat protein
LKISSNWSTYSQLATIYYFLRDYQNALENYDKALMINPNSYEDYVQRGNVYFESRDAENALKNFDKAI